MKEKLEYYHLKSESYINDHLLFNYIIKISNVIGEIYRYVDMFEKLAD